MKRSLGFVLLLAGVPFLARAADTGTTQKLEDRLNSARNTIDEIMSVPDKKVPDKIARKAFCVGVIPSVVKGAFIVGAEYGQGVVACRKAHGWRAQVFVRL